jgi:hypothetical protein
VCATAIAYASALLFALYHLTALLEIYIVVQRLQALLEQLYDTV